MAIYGCGLPVCGCQPAVAGGFIYADLRSELSTHLALQALFTQSPVREPLLPAFPFPSTLGEVTLYLLSQACMFIYSSRGHWLFPPLLWSFPPTATFTSFPAPDCWAVLLLLPASVFVYSSHGRWVFPPLLWGFPSSATLTSFPTPGCWVHAPAPTLSSQARLVYLQFRDGFSSPPLQSSGCPTLFATCLYSYCLFLTFSFFPGWGWSVQGVMLIWPRVVCGSTTYRLAHLVRIFPSCLGTHDPRPGGPPGFSL
jgi:hypothetical protein